MDIVLFAGTIEQWRLPGDPARGGDINSPGDDGSRGQYFVETNKSPPINLNLEALFDLIICRTTTTGLLIPCTVEGHELNAIFAQKVPKVKDDQREILLVGTEILPTSGISDTVLPSRRQFYRGWRRLFRTSKDLMSRKV